MMLSAASARTLKGNHHGGYGGYGGHGGHGGHAPSVRPQALFPPNSLKGPFLPDKLGCGDLMICVSRGAVGDKTFKANAHAKEGEQTSEFVFTGIAYCAEFTQNLKGPDVYIEFFLDDVMVHKGNYQQNFCFMQSGAITTDDPNADTYEGSWPRDKQGGVLIKSLE